MQQCLGCYIHWLDSWGPWPGRRPGRVCILETAGFEVAIGLARCIVGYIAASTGGSLWDSSLELSGSRGLGCMSLHATVYDLFNLIGAIVDRCKKLHPQWTWRTSYSGGGST